MAEEKAKEQNPDNEKKKVKAKRKRTLLQKIINVFLYIGLAVFILVLVAFGFSQTSTFKNYLRETLIEQADSLINGKLYIEEINGTIFTSLVLKNTVISSEQDTLLNAESIILKTSPLQLLLKTIYVRNFEIKNANISLSFDEKGELNISKLFPPSEEETDTSKSSFPFDIEVANLNFKNVNFSLQNYDKKGRAENYSNLNMNDLRVHNINLSLNVFADINENEYKLNIHKLYADPNISTFVINNLSGNFLVSKNLIEINNFNLLTNKSEFSINSKLKNFNLFDSTSSINDADVDLDVKADSLNFDDLTAFVESTNILKGKVYSEIKTSGKFSDMKINSLRVNYDSTQLKASGNIRNLDNLNSMYISAAFFDSYINQSDINKILPSLEIPTYKELGILKFDTLTYVGKPLKFKTKFLAKTLKGDLYANANLNLEMKEMGYNIDFKTMNFNISAFTGIVSNLNSKGNIKGKGTDPQNLDVVINFIANGSTFEGNKFDTLKLSSSAKAKKINYDLLAVSDTASASLNGFFDFTNKNNPSYEAKGLVKNLNIQKFSKDTTFTTKLNFEIDATGENFDLDKMNLYLSTTLFNSSVEDILIDTTRAIVDLGYDTKGQRVLNIVSDLADITLTGNYSLNQTIKMLGSESEFISTSVQKKLDEIFPGLKNKNETVAKLSNQKSISSIVDSATTLEFTIEFKDFDLLSVFLGKNQLEVDGNLNGKIVNTMDSISLSINSNLNYLKYWGKDDVFFLTNLSLNMNLENALNASSLKDIKTDLKFNIKRIFMGSDIKEVAVNLNLFQNSADVNLSASYENNIYAKLLGKIDFQNSGIDMNLDSLVLRYNQFMLKNKKDINLVYSQDKIDINRFVLARNDGEINIKGSLRRSGNQDLKIAIKNFRGKDVSVNVFELNPSNALLAKLNLDAEVKGDFFAPIINSEVKIDSVTYKQKVFGRLVGKFNYKDKNIIIDMKFLDFDSTLNKSPFKIYGNIPYDLAFEGVRERSIKSKNMDMTLLADNFDLGAFGNTLPSLKQLTGNLTAKLNITGTPENLNPKGYLTLTNTNFIAAANNLEYNAGLKIKVEPNLLTLDSLLIRNSEDTPKGGTMTGSGKVEMENLDITSSEISVDGTLKVLADQSKGASSTVYGDLVISTNGNVNFKVDKNGAYLEAPIKVIEANLTFPPSQGGYSNNSDNFIYRFAKDTSNHKNEIDFDSLVKLSQERNSDNKSKTSDTKFDYKIDVQVENEAKIIFILSKELNQKLTAILEGNFQYEKIGGRPDAQGELKLLDGSTLEFIKTLTASGSIRFESELDNPYLDITATYTDYFYPNTPQSSEATGTETNNASVVNEELAAVKIKVQGPLKELDKNLIQEKNNVSVYIGETNINNNTPSTQYDVSDAITFIALGKFPEEGGSGSDPFAGASTSIAGSLLGGFLNSYLGDYVKSVQLRRVGTTTKVSLSGRVNKFRYSIGGATDVFQDLSQANVKIEYPIYKSLLVRLERKEALSESNINNEMINELGLKYRFEF